MMQFLAVLVADICLLAGKKPFLHALHWETSFVAIKWYTLFCIALIILGGFLIGVRGLITYHSNTDFQLRRRILGESVGSILIGLMGAYYLFMIAKL